MAEVRLHVDCQAAFEDLEPAPKRSLRAWADRLAKDPTAGDQVQRHRIPKVLQRKYTLTNLWRIPLAQGWRALYTLQAEPGGTFAVVVLIVDHKSYDRLFGYSTSSRGGSAKD